MQDSNEGKGRMVKVYLVLFEQSEVPEGMDGSSGNIESQVILLEHKAA